MAQLECLQIRLPFRNSERKHSRCTSGTLISFTPIYRRGEIEKAILWIRPRRQETGIVVIGTCRLTAIHVFSHDTELVFGGPDELTREERVRGPGSGLHSLCLLRGDHVDEQNS